MRNQDANVVKIGKKEYVQNVKLNAKAGDGETMIHMDFTKPKLKGYLFVKESVIVRNPCKKYHSNRLIWDPKKKKFLCSECGQDPKKKPRKK